MPAKIIPFPKPVAKAKLVFVCGHSIILDPIPTMTQLLDLQQMVKNGMEAYCETCQSIEVVKRIG
jgi:hypothetical protein